jgi:misacylated tRNA(Ala) deacylase
MGDRLYLDDPYLREFDAEIRASAEGGLELSCTCFYPGGGGQPPDRGTVTLGGETVPVSNVHEDDAGRLWHAVSRPMPVGAIVRGTIDWAFRYALMRHHALLHVVNTIALRLFGGTMTGAQLGAERSRIDFKVPSLARDDLPAFEAAVNEVIARDLVITSAVIHETEYRQRPLLRRTLNVEPPIVDGKVRIVEIASFDAQACGGTHVHSTREIGAARIEKLDNKGKDNKRVYWSLATPGA